jgi:signal peptidase I
MTENIKELAKKAKAELEESRPLMRKAKKILSPDQRQEAEGLLNAIKTALKAKDETVLAAALLNYSKFKQRELAGIRVNKTWEGIKELAWILAIVLFIRWIFIEPYRIPSGSMVPTLLVGDQLMVNKLIYGVQIPFTTKKLFNLKSPKRGDVIIFKFPPKPSGSPYVKRVVGVGGDEVAVRQGQLFVNGKPVPRELQGSYTGPNDPMPCEDVDLLEEDLDGVRHNILLCHTDHEDNNFGPVKVPEGAVFGMGDNRDNSADSRYWGFIPLGHIKGKALIIHLPLDPTRHYFPRWERFFKIIR